jgi:pimeloyl-ACP methyl ester carboxylesterase
MVRKAYTDAGEKQIHYRYAGERHNDTPAIVFFHQNPSSSQIFEELMERLEDEYYVVAPDMPGYGQSFTPDEVSAFDYYTRVLTAAVNDIGVDEFHVVGHHTGAGIGVDVATNEPERVRTVTLIGPPYFTREEREKLSEEAYGETPVPPIREDGSHLLDHWELFDGEGASSEIQHRMVVDALLARTGNEQSHGVGRDQDLPTLFGNIEVPRMIMAAPDDILWDAFERARREHPDVRAVEVEGASWEPLRDAETIASELRSFLADHGY